MNPKKQKEKQRRRARKLADEAWQAAEDGNLDLAEKIIRRAVDTQPDNPRLWQDQGAILALRENDREAEDSFRTALRLAPTFAEAYDRLAALRARQGYLTEAVALQAQAVKHAPHDVGCTDRLEGYQALASRQHILAAPGTPSSVEAGSTAPEAARAGVPAATAPGVDWLTRLTALDWKSLGARLTREGWELVPRLMDGETCASLRDLFDCDVLFAKTVVMNRPDFGQGAYRYFREPLPEVVTSLRRAVYPYVARIANHWQELLDEPERYPQEWDSFRDECHQAGQVTPTPILLKYGPGGFNALHRDLRGRVFFPIQLAVVLSPRAGETEAAGFQGGEFLFCDVPEAKRSRRREIAAGLGDALLFCTRDRLVSIGGAHGLQPVKHGVAPITAGTRLVLGVPFHEYR